MGDADGLTARALNFGLDISGNVEKVAADLVVSADHDGRLLRRAIARIEHGCREHHTLAEDRALLVLGVALAGGYNSDLGLFDVPRGSDGGIESTPGVS